MPLKQSCLGKDIKIKGAANNYKTKLVRTHMPRELRALIKSFLNKRHRSKANRENVIRAKVFRAKLSGFSNKHFAGLEKSFMPL